MTTRIVTRVRGNGDYVRTCDHRLLRPREKKKEELVACRAELGDETVINVVLKAGLERDSPAENQGGKQVTGKPAWRYNDARLRGSPPVVARPDPLTVPFHNHLGRHRRM